jgi:hypothetical protein
MGFHKRWINEEILRIRYKNGGIDEVKRQFSADALMLSDEFSIKVHNAMVNKEDLESLFSIEHKT